ncbi:TetR/AcrR family transcriptional regulator [Paraglaciecola arctica]|uniref:Transcriptional regulator, TetR family protein n=1 Tax=Paraglaciecola arctica BSs20135 TaxID=493475 RepID=K6ZEG5_9ALTE|nr:TetR/AcrR family transcriptional regulator [Paraglaciecola arctica]GAC21785.1 transcriptional regulator, TetR family protein [Paraglaciecola arctica BSs20135]
MSDAKSTILKAASELFLEGGTSALSVRAISKRAGVSTIGIYSHFKGKQGILDELYIEGFEKVFSAMDILKSAKGPRETILQGVKGYLEVADKYEAHYRLIFGESDAGYSPSEEARAVSEKAFKMLIDVSSLILPEDTSLAKKQHIALEIWAFVHGYVSLKHHAISTLISPEEWNTLALNALSTHIDAIIAKHA